MSSAYNLMREMHVFGGETSPFKLLRTYRRSSFKVQDPTRCH